MAEVSAVNLEAVDGHIAMAKDACKRYETVLAQRIALPWWRWRNRRDLMSVENQYSKSASQHAQAAYRLLTTVSHGGRTYYGVELPRGVAIEPTGDGWAIIVGGEHVDALDGTFEDACAAAWADWDTAPYGRS